MDARRMALREIPSTSEILPPSIPRCSGETLVVLQPPIPVDKETDTITEILPNETTTALPLKSVTDTAIPTEIDRIDTSPIIPRTR